jgi:hypothetical protein
VLFAKCNYDGQIKEDEVGMTCSMNGGRGTHVGFDGKARRIEAIRKTWT